MVILVRADQSSLSFHWKVRCLAPGAVPGAWPGELRAHPSILWLGLSLTGHQIMGDVTARTEQWPVDRQPGPAWRQQEHWTVDNATLLPPPSSHLPPPSSSSLPAGLPAWLGSPQNNIKINNNRSMQTFLHNLQHSTSWNKLESFFYWNLINFLSSPD